MKRIILLTITINVVVLFYAIAQPMIEWQLTLGGSDHEIARSIQQTSDGGYIVAGYSLSNDGDVLENYGSDDFWIVKLSDSGNIEWQKTFGGTDIDRAWSIQQTSDNGFIVAGSSRSSNGDVTVNHGSDDFWVVKLSGSGNIEWQNSYGGSLSDFAYSVQQTFDGGYIVAGKTYSNDGDITGNHGQDDFWVVKLTELGIIEWQKTFGGSDDDDALSIQQTFDGGYIVAGNSFSNDGDVDIDNTNVSYWVVKLSEIGEMEWQKTFGGTSSDYGRCIQQTIDGGYIIAGSAFSNDEDVTGNHGLNDCWIVKLSILGDIEWQKPFGGTHSDNANSIQQTSDSGYIIGGKSQSNDGDVMQNYGWADFWILKVSNSGNIEWQKNLGGTSNDVIYSVQQTSDYGYIIAGYTQSNNGDITSNNGGDDFWIVKLSPLVNGIESIVEKKSISVFPNPTRNQINIETVNEYIGSEYYLYDISGNLVASGILTIDESNINLKFLPPGTYAIQIIAKDEIVNLICIKQ